MISSDAFLFTSAETVFFFLTIIYKKQRSSQMFILNAIIKWRASERIGGRHLMVSNEAILKRPETRDERRSD